MDDETFERFIASIITSTQKDGRLNGINPDEIREAFYLLRYNDNSIPILDADTENKYLTIEEPCRTIGHGIGGFLICIILLPIVFIWGIFVIIFEILFPHCGGISCTIPCSSRV